MRRLLKESGLFACGGSGAVVASAGGATVTLPMGSSIPAGSPFGSCTMTVNVTASAGGSYLTTMVVGALKTSNGNNATSSQATLTVVRLLPVVAASIPTLSEWAMIALTLLLALVGFATLRRRNS